jgi:hypothetical protein
MSFLIREAQREGAKIVLGIAGTSGSGKTYSALMLAYGLAGKSGKSIGFLDTENKRGSLYADILPEKFKIADFEPPFSPERYIEGIRAFEKAGCKVLVIDSVTHEWEGTGGCEEIATEGIVWPKPARWNVAKLEHKKFMNALLQSSMDIICCIRAREKVDMKNPKEIKQLGLQPICEKNFMFEMTASVRMEDEGKRQVPLKCPEALRPIMGRGNGYLTIEDGVKLREWIDGGEKVDRDLERFRSELKSACEWGMKALEETWKGLDADVRKALKDELPALKASAEGYDKHASMTSEPHPQPAA